MRRGACLAAAVLLLGGLGAPAASAQTEAVSVARALIDAENAHNVRAAVDLFAPGAIMKLPTGPLLTRAEIEQWQRDLAAGNFRAEISTPVAVTPEVVTFSGTVALDSFRRLGSLVPVGAAAGAITLGMLLLHATSRVRTTVRR